MLKDRMIRVKLKKSFKEQRPISYIGKCTAFSDYWVVMEGRALMVARSQPNHVQVDKDRSAILVPRDNIESIQVLPDGFDIKKIEILTEGQQLHVKVEGAADTYIGEIGEG
ncbi:MAG: hypothetical protein HYV27_13475 [Candidatus Hydrogenedentes bacterium]|nr:hypothetical protein [Candidatus Hydrogenedentota bacterium]